MGRARGSVKRIAPWIRRLREHVEPGDEWRLQTTGTVGDATTVQTWPAEAANTEESLAAEALDVAQDYTDHRGAMTAFELSLWRHDRQHHTTSIRLEPKETKAEAADYEGVLAQQMAQNNLLIRTLVQSFASMHNAQNHTIERLTAQNEKLSEELMGYKVALIEAQNEGDSEKEERILSKLADLWKAKGSGDATLQELRALRKDAATIAGFLNAPEEPGGAGGEDGA